MLSEKIIKTIHEEFPELQNLVSSGIEAEAQKIRDSIPSGFVELGELDYDYMLNNENVVKLKTKSIAYVNGYRVEIPAGTVIDIGKAPEKEPREDLLFLEAWKDQDFNRDGKLKWRIRHIADLNPFFTEDCMTEVGYGWNTTYGYYPKLVTGGNDSLLPFDTTNATTKYNSGFIKANNSNANIYATHLLGDSGLFVCGTGTDSAKTRLKTLDGFVYAIPMFRLYRKPSCGKAIPFEYQKINPKVDYSKFKNLISNSNVESSKELKILGTSVVNLAPRKTMEFVNNQTSYQFVEYATLLKRDTTYTVMADITELGLNIDSSCTVGFMFTFNNGMTFTNGNHLRITKTGKLIGTLKTLNSTINTQYYTKLRLFCDKALSINGGTLKADNIVLLEGDWTNYDIPNLPLGLSSLGDLDNNIITAKSKVLSPNQHDPKLGNVKLPSVQGSNFIHSENLIPPKVSFDVKREESVISSHTSLGEIPNLQGGETHFFKEIKGRTLQNLVSGVYCSQPGVQFNGTNSFTINLPTDGTNPHFRVNLYYKGLKANSTYTIVFDYESNLETTTDYYVSKIDTYDKYLMVRTENPLENRINFSNAPNGTAIQKFTTKSYIYGKTMAVEISLIMLKAISTSGKYFTAKNIRVFEGDLSNEPLSTLPYVSNIESTGERENKVILTRTNRNLIDLDAVNYKKTNLIFNRSDGSFVCIDNTVYNEVQLYAYLVKGKTYKLTMNGHNLTSTNLQVLFGKVKAFNSNLVCKNVTMQNDGVFEFREESGWYSLHTPNLRNVVNNITLEEGTTTNGYFTPNKYIQEIHLKEPIRSLLNNVSDRIVGDKILRKVGKLVLDGTESQWGTPTFNSTRDYVRFELNNVWGVTKINSGKCHQNIGNAQILCNNLEVDVNTGGDLEKTREHLTLFGNTNNGQLRIMIKASNLTTQDTNGFKTWLSKNPIIIYYETETEIEEPLEPNFLMESARTYRINEPLRGIPDGAKDELTENKLIRRCGEITLRGGSSELWNIGYGGATGSYNKFEISLDPVKFMEGYTFRCICDRFHYEPTAEVPSEWAFRVSYSTSNNGAFALFNIPTSVVPLHDLKSWKSWLNQNPIKILYQLDTPTEIPLFETSSTSIENLPMHSYCGNVYVTNGSNYVETSNTLNSDQVIVQTDFRTITNKEVITNCMAKKNEYGLTYTFPDCKNIYNPKLYTLASRGNNVFVSRDANDVFTVTMGGTTQTDWGLSTSYNTDKPLKFYNLKKGTKIYCKAEGTFTTIWYCYIRVSDGKSVINAVSSKSVTVTLPEDCSYLEFVFNKNSTNASYTVSNIMIGYGEMPTEYTPSLPTIRYLENTMPSDLQDMRHKVSLTGFNYDQILNESFDSLLRGEL